ncbi:unnamed protein product [Trifolium pratense]|uniref:Uncharacterized protein n=1 Tax=Trifolium pratense TaxID=57577 RepID=A0ACB0IWK6_TRIPR|nr:unnamed protein product [Trifolium pratense]
MLETQISQVAQQQAALAAPAGTFPGQPEPNPKGHANALHAVTTRSGKELQDPVARIVKKPENNEKIDEAKETSKDTVRESESAKPEDKEETKEKDSLPVYKTPIPFPHRLAKPKTDSQFKKFVELLKQLNITIPFSEAIAQMPTYSKFLKEILSNKRKLDDDIIVALTEECSAIFKNKMPPKLKDPGSFSIPCVIGNFVIDKALCDLGASVSLMPLSISKKLNLNDLKPTRMSLQLADRSIKHPVGILENIPEDLS